MTLLSHAWKLKRNPAVPPNPKRPSTFSSRFLPWRKIVAMRRQIWWTALAGPSCTLINDPSHSYTKEMKAQMKKRWNTKICVHLGWDKSSRFSTFWRYTWNMMDSSSVDKVNAWTFLWRFWAPQEWNLALNHGESLKTGILIKERKSQPTFSYKTRTRSPNTWLSISIRTGLNGRPTLHLS